MIRKIEEMRALEELSEIDGDVPAETFLDSEAR